MTRFRVSIVPAWIMLVLPVAFADGQTHAIHGSSISVDIAGVATVLDNHACTIRQYSPEGRLLREIGGQGWGNDQFDRPTGIWAKNGIDVFVADYGNHRIQRFDNTLAYVSTLFTRDDNNPDNRFGYPTSVSLSRLGDLFICDTENKRIAKVGSTNQIGLTFGGFGAGKGRLVNPIQLECGPEDEIFVLDPPHVVVFDTFGNYIEELGPGVFRHPVCIGANQSTILVVDSTAAYTFDVQNHLLSRLSLSDTTGTGEITGCSITSSQVYLIGSSGLRVVPVTDMLDKDRNSR